MLKQPIHVHTQPQYQNQNKNYCKSSDQLNLSPGRVVHISPKILTAKSTNLINKLSPRVKRFHTTNFNDHTEKIPVTSKIKRKIFETITNRVSQTNLHKSSVSCIFCRYCVYSLNLPLFFEISVSFCLLGLHFQTSVSSLVQSTEKQKNNELKKTQSVPRQLENTLLFQIK